MNIDVNNFSAVIGVLGAYFSILLVLAVSVETIIEPFSFFKGLQKPVNPDDILNSVQEWLPEGSGEAAKVIAIQTYAAKTNLNLNLLDQNAKKLDATPFEDLLKPRHADDPQKRPVLLSVLGNTTEHFAEHRATIEKML